MGLFPNLPDMGKIEAALDEDFSALTSRLDQLIALEQQILAALQGQSKEPGQ